MGCHALDLWFFCDASLCDFHEGWSFILSFLYHRIEAKSTRIKCNPHVVLAQLKFLEMI